MGMYDYVGHDGDQVKCFYVPCIHVNSFSPKNGKADVKVYSSGGRLVSANTAPYMTPYYNYGPDFAILDYRWYQHETPKAHIFKNGQWVETVEWDAIADDYDFPPVSVGYYGDRINVNSAKSFKDFVNEFIKTDKDYEHMVAENFENFNLQPGLISRDRALSMGHDALVAEIAIRNDIESTVFKHTFEPFNQKWMDKSHESDLDIIGYLIWDWYDVHSENRDPYRDFTRLEYEWYALFSGILHQAKSRFDNPVEEYFEWCDKEGIVIDKDAVRELFRKYTQDPPKNVVEEYAVYWDGLPDYRKKDWTES